MDVGIDIYTVSMRRLRSNAGLPFENFDGAKSSTLGSLGAALTPLVMGNYKGVPEKTMTVKGLVKSDTGYSGVVSIGTYGRSSDVVDVNDGKMAFAKDKHHADTTPYYFRIHLPKKGSTGLFAAQRLGQSGAGTALKAAFADYFLAAHPDFRLHIGSVTPDYIMDKLIANGTPKAVRFIKHSVPADFADVVSGKSKETEGSVEVIIRPKNDRLFRKTKIKSALRSVDGISSLYAFDAFEPDDVKMQILVDGKIRTVNLANRGKMRSSFDITTDVQLGQSGFPDPDSVAECVEDLLKEAGRPLGIRL